MRTRVAALAAAFAMAVAAPASVSTQDTADDGVRRLLDRLEQIVERGDASGYGGLLADTIDQESVGSFLETEITPSVTRAVIQERARVPLVGTLPGRGFSLALDVFQEYGDRGRIAAWSLDVKRFDDSDSEWRIAGQTRVSSVEDIYRLSLDGTRQFAVKNLTLTDHDLELTLRDGSVFVSIIDQGPTAIVFVGVGDMTFRPRIEREASQVRIFSGADAIATPFDSMYLRFNPADFERLFSTQLVSTTVNRDELRKADRIFREQSPKSFGLDLADLSREDWSLVPEPRDLVAEIATRRFETLTYSRSATQREDVSLFDRRRQKTIALYSSDATDGAELEIGGGNEPAFDVSHYDLDVTVDPYRRWIEGRARLQVRILGRGVGTLMMRLAQPLVVHSIISEEYGRLFSMRVKDQDSLMIGLPTAVPSGAQVTLTITYTGRLEPQTVDTEALAGQVGLEAGLDPSRPPQPSFLFSSQVGWYPRASASHYATATLRISVPAGLECVASGTNDPRSTVTVPATASAPERTTYVFHAERPLRYFAFVLSQLEPTAQSTVRFAAGSGEPGGPTRTPDGVLELSVLANPGHRRGSRAAAERVAEIAQYYQSLLDDAPYPSFTVAIVENMRPGGHSPGYFAILNEPPVPATFYPRRNDPAFFDRLPDFILAHEVAHQWWGQAVGWRNYNEQWLSEGFAQYFAALYSAHASGSDAAGRETFRDVLRQMRRWATDMTDQGPISLGSRLGHLQADSRIFRALVYNKGALVLHMLRQLVGDEVFFDGLRRFYHASRYRSVGTAELRAVMELEANRPLGRFFERWIYGVRLPRLSFSYQMAAGEVGIRIEQIGDVFELPVVVTLRYADGSAAEVIVKVTDAVTQATMPLAGTLRGVEISREEPPLAEIVRN